MLITETEIKKWCSDIAAEQKELLKTLAAIPSPSHHEEKRAEFILDWLKNIGVNSAYIDDAKNVVLPFNCNGKNDIAVFMAHIDVVFGDTDFLPVEEKNGKLYAPGVGDDTANVVALMLCVKFMLSRNISPAKPLLIVFNSCEEGLGNLKGVKNIMRDYSGRISTLVSFDGGLDCIVTRAVGSHRWRITIRTEGGHSFGDFGNRNAIECMASLISTLYNVDVPQKPNTRTTYNVGTIKGGTSVNTIAQEAEMLYEYRSDGAECLMKMRAMFDAAITFYKASGIDIECELLGERPCMGDLDADAMNALVTSCCNAVESVTTVRPKEVSGSTDANIPFSLGVPAAVFGLYDGDGAHTRSEWVDISSLTIGLRVGLTLMARWF